MPEFSIDRISRRNQNSKQDKIQTVKTSPSINSLREGQEVIFQGKNKPLKKYLKHNGMLWSLNMTHNGDMFVDKKLTVGALEYKNKFIHYKTFIHNFEEDISNTEYYLPWFSTGESTTMDTQSSGFITPFSMTLMKIILRCDNLSGSDDIVIKVEKQDDDANEDTIATATYDVSEVGAVSNYNNFELNTSDFDNEPTVTAGQKVGISIQANSDITDATAYFWITSVWKTYIEI